MPIKGGELPYHERQTPLRQLCLMHALNMLFGEPRLTQAYMDQVCDQLVSTSPEDEQDSILAKLTTTNPHKGRWLGGNYDVNVALYILECELKYQVNYYRKPKNNNKEDDLELMAGILVNVPGTFRWTRHWIMYKRWSVSTGNNGIGEPPQWYQLDSKASGPIKIQSIHTQVDKHLQTGDTILTIQKQQG
ncbi:MAG: hypothetical protein SGBAC_009187 [Bacillariaceae sp.]